ncbi:MAG: hypothetical protein FWC50_04595, partial [Planctomycetaceae bacterium]|nr:hypothetical protein [Planctomycetaceae bacterium]
GMDTKVESDSNRIGHEHRSFRWSLLSNSYVRDNIASLIKDKTQETAAGNASDRFNPSLTLRAVVLLCHH